MTSRRGPVRPDEDMVTEAEPALIDAVPPRVSLREAQKQLTRQRLLDAAEEVFERVGYRGATVEQIASCAGANRATFYLHFQGKVDLARGLAGKSAVAWIDAARELVAMEHIKEANVRKWLEKLRLAYGESQAIREVLLEAEASDPGIAAESVAFFQRLVDRVMAPLFERIPASSRSRQRTRVFLLWIALSKYFTYTEVQGLEISGNGLGEFAAMFTETLSAQTIRRK
jgi:AcrR family transcriptional regulator